MSLPTLSKTWQYDTNVTIFDDIARGSTNAHADKRGLLLAIKNAMVDTGSSRGFSTPWEVRGSSDSSTASLLAVGAGGPGTDRWLDIDDLVWSTSDGGARSWIVLRQAAISTTFELLIDLRQDSVSDDGSEIRTIVSQAGFTGGTTTARPTATDERTLSDTGGTWGGGASGSTTGPYTMQFWISSDGECTRVVTFNTNGVAIGFWMFDVPKNPKTAWTDPYIACVQGNGDSAVVTYAFFHEGVARILSKFGTLDTDLYLSADGAANQTIGELLNEPNQLDESLWFGDMGLVSTTSGFRGRQGEVFDLYWTHPFIQEGQTFPATGATREFVVFGDMVFPWDGSFPVTK